MPREEPLHSSPQGVVTSTVTLPMRWACQLLSVRPVRATPGLASRAKAQILPSLCPVHSIPAPWDISYGCTKLSLIVRFGNCIQANVTMPANCLAATEFGTKVTPCGWIRCAVGGAVGQGCWLITLWAIMHASIAEAVPLLCMQSCAVAAGNSDQRTVA